MIRNVVKFGLTPIALLLLAAGPRAAVVSHEEESGLERFTKMMPVFGHPRCVNCHGAVNPLTEGGNHGGGPIDANLKSSGELDDNRICLECHTAKSVSADDTAGLAPKDRWRLPKREQHWAGKSVVETCRQISAWAKVEGGQRVSEHLLGDPLITWGFMGRRADATDTADPPPMTINEFEALFMEWGSESKLSCEPPTKWTGTITVEHIKDYNSTKDFEGGGNKIREETKQAGTMRYQIDVVGDSGRAHIGGTESYKYVRTWLNPSAAGCGFKLVHKNGDYSYTGPEAPIRLKFEKQAGSADKFIVRFIAPPYEQVRKTETRREGATCKMVRDGVETKTDTLRMTDQTNRVMLIGSAVELKGLNDDVTAIIMKGQQTAKVGDTKLIMRWDLARKP